MLFNMVNLLSNMKTLTENVTKSRTTLFLTPENKQKLGLIPRGKRTTLINKAIAIFLAEMEKEEKNKELMQIIENIVPVEPKYSSVEATRALRANNLNQLINQE